MMFEIKNKQILAQSIKQIEVSAPELAAKAQAGQFVILRIDETGERIPLTLADFDREMGTITLIYQEVGRTTLDLGRLEAGDYLLDLVGPLGKPSEIEKYGTVVCVGGGVGIAPIYPITRELARAGNKIISIIGARSKDHLILAEEMQSISENLYIATDDGTLGHKGFVTDILKEIIDRGEEIDLVVAIGYWNKPEATAESFPAPGWVRTGDIAKIDEDGFIWLCGRLKEMIKTSGFSVFPAEVEEYMYKHPAVLECAVVGTPHEYRGEDVKAFVVLKPEYVGKVSEQELVEWAREQMSVYKYPRIIEFRDSLPKTGTGKILRKELKAEELAKANK
jgi:ferredoxin--NADP+ reductase